MRKVIFLILAVSMMVFTSCSNKNSGKKDMKAIRDEVVLPTEMILSQSDTDQVYNLVEHYLNCLKYNKVDEAMSMLYHYNENDKIAALPADIAAQQKKVLTTFAGKKYEIEHVIFHKDNDSEVKYNVILFDNKPGENKPNKVGFILRPVRQNSKWYLALADVLTDKVKSDIEH